MGRFNQHRGHPRRGEQRRGDRSCHGQGYYSPGRECPPGRPPLYRARDGKIMGVMKGLSRHFGISVTALRVGAVIVAVSTGFWPALFLYLIAGFVMKPEPVVPFDTPQDREFYESYTSQRTMALDRLKRKFENIDRRIRRMEDIVTSKDYDWERRFNSGR